MRMHRRLLHRERNAQWIFSHLLLVLSFWLQAFSFYGGDDEIAADEIKGQGEEDEQKVAPWDFTRNHGFMWGRRIDETSRFRARRQGGNDFMHGTDAHVGGCLGAEEIIAFSSVMSSIDIVFITDVDAAGRASS